MTRSPSLDLEQVFLKIQERLGVQEIPFRVIAYATTGRSIPCCGTKSEAVKRLRMVVRDDGCGIGYEGLSGMRERANRIGARLQVTSRAAGTEIELSIPGKIAFEGRKNP